MALKLHIYRKTKTVVSWTLHVIG